MSLGKDIQRAEKKIEVLEAQAKADDVSKAELAGEIGILKADLAAAITTGTDSVAAVKAEAEKAKVELDDQIKVAGEKVVAVTSELEAARVELKAAKIKLANPAFADAAASGEAKAADATAESNDGQKVSCFAKYSAITDPVERSKFWDEHSAEIKAECAAALQSE